MHNNSVEKKLIKGKKLRKGEQSFLYVTHHLNFMQIAIKFEIFHTVTYLWYAQGQSKISSKGNQKLRKGEQSFLYATHPLNRIHIAIKFHEDILYCNPLTVCIRSVKNLIKGK